MNIKFGFVASVSMIVGLSFTADVRASEVVYVSMDVAAPAYSALSNGSVTGQAGTVASPFGSIQAAYHFLWNKTGAHEIRLGAGLYSGAKLGWDNNERYNMVFMDAAKLPGNPAWTSVTLKPNAGAVTIENVLPFGNPGNKRPGAYEYLQSDSATIIDRGGLFRLPTGAPNFNGMIFQDLTIDLGGGTAIVGSQGTGVQQWTLNNTDVLMRAEYFDSDYAGGNPWRRSALFSHHNTTADMPGSFMSFNNSRIYVDPSPGESGDFYTPGTNPGMFVGYRYFADAFPDGFFNGNDTSDLLLWDSNTAVTGNEPFYTGDIWSSRRSPSILYNVEDTGDAETGGFVVGFNAVPEPSTLALAGLAGAGFLMSRLLSRRGRSPEES